jgi:hypothetical protein
MTCSFNKTTNGGIDRLLPRSGCVRSISSRRIFLEAAASRAFPKHGINYQEQKEISHINQTKK